MSLLESHDRTGEESKIPKTKEERIASVFGVSEPIVSAEDTAEKTEEKEKIEKVRQLMKQMYEYCVPENFKGKDRDKISFNLGDYEVKGKFWGHAIDRTIIFIKSEQTLEFRFDGPNQIFMYYNGDYNNPIAYIQYLDQGAGKRVEVKKGMDLLIKKLAKFVPLLEKERTSGDEKVEREVKDF